MLEQGAAEGKGGDVKEDGEAWEGGGKRYRIHKVVGNGAFGIVWRAVEEGVKNETVAIKKVILDRRYHNRELEMMKGMDHDCVIRLLNHFENDGCVATKKGLYWFGPGMEQTPTIPRQRAAHAFSRWHTADQEQPSEPAVGPLKDAPFPAICCEVMPGSRASQEATAMCNSKTSPTTAFDGLLPT